MEEGLRGGVVEADGDAYALLAEAWLRAREFDQAIPALEAAAAASEDGERYVRLGEAHVAREAWGPATEALMRAGEKGDLANPGRVQLLLGVASFNRDELAAARRHFDRAERSAATREEAGRWLRHLDRLRTSADPNGAPPQGG
jgi:tetratricopeptide (TPR) repeat protein